MKGVPDKIWQTALYCRLSREDGDRPESDSIGNQRKLLAEYVEVHPELNIYDYYADDGYTGTNFDRPDFQRMLRDIESGSVNCVLVKDLSRFGRNYIDAGRYLERWLPEHGARFVAVTDNIDSNRGAYDMMMPLKNLFNAQYAKDISQKVKSSFRAKQKRGEFIGAFASYGYLKDSENRNHLVVDPVASKVVQRIFSLFESGTGKIRIAKLLNEEGVPCPSEYKRLMGERYRNCNKLEGTTYWTYATIHRILNSELYIGNMEQGRNERTQLHGAAKQKDKSDWVVVADTHEPIISRNQWERVRTLLKKRGRTPDFQSNVSPFAGYLKCGDCGRAMSKTTWSGKIFYTCGSYKRYGADVCSKHYITQDILEDIVLSDLNHIMAGVKNLQELAEQGVQETKRIECTHGEEERLNGALSRVRRMKQGIYEDYKESILTKDEYLRYRKDYNEQENTLLKQLAQLEMHASRKNLPEQAWVADLVRLGRLTSLDRPTIAETLKEIRIFEDGTIEITYLFSDELRALLEGSEE
ncbi:MAG: recombinase family protein [Lawsonibacter sp.]